MQTYSLTDMRGGWFVGDFDPVLERTSDVEVAVKYYRKGDYEPAHYHCQAREWTVIASGRVEMNGQQHAAGTVVAIAPFESTDFRALEDTITVVVKRPSVPGDKFLTAPGEAAPQSSPSL